tara:strand:+ start:79 stop:957 length:879 start_codon:yes stop_codon:yes gene_type:complete
MKKLYVLLFISLISLDCWSQNKTEAYIEKYKDIAINEMNMYAIPASITLAQGILESGNGESRLAVEGKNHFGIKCHNNWNGPSIKEDDDEKQECFRKYKSVKDSYRDHSLFLTQRGRYSSLFDDFNYKSWAKGLSKAGYATNPKYADLLIDLIEKYNLDRFDSKEDRAKRFYFANSIGIPYLTGFGAYYFSNKHMFYSDFQTSVLISRINIGYNYDLYNGLYFGLNSGSGIFNRDNDLILAPRFSVEFAYTKAFIDKEKRRIIKLGADYSRIKHNDNIYYVIPYINFIYLIK